MRFQKLSTVLSTACVLILALYLVPYSEEQATMLARDGYPESALSKLESLYASGSHEPQILMQLYNIRLQLGRPREAEQALAEYLDVRPF